MMVNLKEIPGIFECFNFEQILSKLSEGKEYLVKGEDKFPIDLEDSVRFLEDLEDFFKSLVYSDRENCNVENHWTDLFQVNGIGTENPRCDFYTRFKVLNAEMQMILTLDNMQSYLSVADFLDTLLFVLYGNRK